MFIDKSDTWGLDFASRRLSRLYDLAWVRPRHKTRRGVSAPRLSLYWRLHMEKRVCVFVDGENLRHSIVDAFENQGLFERHQYLPVTANWAEFYDWVVCAIVGIGTSGRRLRTYWYVTDDLAFWPYGIKSLNRSENELKAKKVLSRNRRFRSELSNLSGDQARDRLREKVDELIEEQRKMSSRFEGWKRKQEDIANRHRSVEFRRAGVWKTISLVRAAGPIALAA